MATLREKLAAVIKEKYEDHSRKDQARKTNSPRIQENYITQVSEEIEDILTKKLSEELSRPESCILSRLDEVFLNPQAQVHTAPFPETSRNSNRENQGTNEDRSQNDLYPEVGVSLSHSSQDVSTEETSHRA